MTITERQREARSRNGRASRGPKTARGKARAAQNARRHGLTISALRDPSWPDEIVRHARLLVGEEADDELLELASQVAAAQLDLTRVRRARLDLLAAAPENPDLKRLAALENYEQRAFSRRTRAMRVLSASGLLRRGGGKET